MKKNLFWFCFFNDPNYAGYSTINKNQQFFIIEQDFLNAGIKEKKRSFIIIANTNGFLFETKDKITTDFI